MVWPGPKSLNNFTIFRIIFSLACYKYFQYPVFNKTGWVLDFISFKQFSQIKFLSFPSNSASTCPGQFFEIRFFLSWNIFSRWNSVLNSWIFRCFIIKFFENFFIFWIFYIIFSFFISKIVIWGIIFIINRGIFFCFLWSFASSDFININGLNLFTLLRSNN